MVKMKKILLLLYYNCSAQNVLFPRDPFENAYKQILTSSASIFKNTSKIEYPIFDLNNVFQAKCGLVDNWEEKFDGYNASTPECVAALAQWNDDITSGVPEAIKMCDSFGERITYGNTPGLLNTKTGFRAFSFGLIDQCRASERFDDNGNLLYKGGYFSENLFDYGILSMINKHGVEFVQECYSSCASDDEEEAFACWTDNCGLTFFNTENQRGICYPEICSPAEVMIVTSRYSADLITSGMSGVLGSETAIAPTTDVTTGLWVQRSSDVAYSAFSFIRKPVKPLYRVKSQVFIAFIVILSCWTLFVINASLLDTYKVYDYKWIKAVSIQRNINKLYDTTRSPKAIKCMDGIRTLSIWWVLVGHTMSQTWYKLSNINSLLQTVFAGNLTAMISATVSVDSFFVMGGLLCAYVSTNKLAQAQKKGFGTWLRAYVIYLLNRWCRLTPVLLITMFVQVAIMPTLGNGPIADSGAFIAGGIALKNIIGQPTIKPSPEEKKDVETKDVEKNDYETNDKEGNSITNEKSENVDKTNL